MTKHLTYILIIFSILSCHHESEMCDKLDVQPQIFPDYKGVTIPSTIAPLNFKSLDSCERIEVKFSGLSDMSITVSGRQAIHIPHKRWSKLIEGAGEVNVLVKTLHGGKWREYAPFSIYISKDSIDQNICYRRLSPGYELYSKMGIYQRRLSDFSEKTIIENTLMENTCVNCHSFAKCDPETMQFHIRGKNGGTILKSGGVVEMINTKTDIGFGCVYPYWHPSGLFIAYSVNNIHQIFHNKPDEILDVYDVESSVVVYDVRESKVIRYPLLKDSSKLNTFPVFSADGKKLYFCSAPVQDVSNHLREIRYSLYCVDFNPEIGVIGDTISKVLEIPGFSISFPRPSYDGRYILFTRSLYGNFTIWHKDADLWILDLQTMEARPVDEVNSDDTESYHSWSSNSKWIIFSSRRVDGLHTRLFFSHVANDGKFSKPFMLPQKDPDYYDRLMQSYNIPEFINEEVDIPVSKIMKPKKRSVSLQDM